MHARFRIGVPTILFFQKLYAVACENSHETAANQHVSKAKTPTASQPKTSLGFHADYRGLKTLIEESCNFCESFSNLALANQCIMGSEPKVACEISR